MTSLVPDIADSPAGGRLNQKKSNLRLLAEILERNGNLRYVAFDHGFAHHEILVFNP